MNEDVLERLMMDRALGELPADAATLLDAYLAGQHATLTERSREFADTVELATKALHPRQPQSLPALKALPFSRRPDMLSPWRLAQMAAALVIGFLIGLTLLRQTAPRHRPPVVVVSATQTAPAVTPASSLWSPRRWIDERRSSSPKEPRLLWSSPVQKPQLLN
jgi:hypothetical protein